MLAGAASGESCSATPTSSSAAAARAASSCSIPGSVGLPFDGDARAAYAMAHDDGSIEHRRSPTTSDARSMRSSSVSATRRGRSARSPDSATRDPDGGHARARIDVPRRSAWYRTNTFRHRVFPPERLAEHSARRPCRCACPRATRRARSDRSSSSWRRLRARGSSTRWWSSTTPPTAPARSPAASAPRSTIRTSLLARARTGARQGRRDVARRWRAHRRARLLPRRRLRGVRAPLRLRPARAAAVRRRRSRSSRASTAARSGSAR